MKIKNILIVLFVIISVVSLFTVVFKKGYKVVVIKDIDTLTLNDSIIYVRYYKDDYGPGIETRVKNLDTPFCFSGINHKLNLLYFDYAKKGDIIIKEKSSDSFYIKRNNTTLGFVLVKCQETLNGQ